MKISITVLFVALFFASCQRCKECKCYKNNVLTIEKECNKSNDKENYFRSWEAGLNTKYDNCECNYVK